MLNGWLINDNFKGFMLIIGLNHANPPQNYAAAFLGRGSRFSSSLSGVMPKHLLPVTTMVGLYPTIKSLIGQKFK